MAPAFIDQEAVGGLRFDESSKTFFQSVEVHERLTYGLQLSLIS